MLLLSEEATSILNQVRAAATYSSEILKPKISPLYWKKTKKELNYTNL